MKKRKTLSAIIMTLFLIINIVMISCGSGGPAPKEGQAAKADGTVVDLVKVSKKIKDAVEFAANVKEVETLVKSINELAKAIGKKIKSDGQFDTESGKNGSLLAGAQSIMLAVKAKLGQLDNKEGISTELKQKVTDSKTKTETFLTKLKDNHSDLGKNEATDAHAKSAIDITDTGTKDKGTSELIALNTSINALLETANDEVEAAIKALINPSKALTAGQSS
ncbi:Vsp1 lipoprotein (plasmid) [Borrelia miyamotoi LB-2001]|uniref:Vsp3S n=2 Tax=Borrelia miyamotoi TaxID=47466 RepID=A0A109Y6N0_9SPIR|nr:Vsp/OspC family lipoprotein [Borrelia miyamotoi]AJA67245.2 Vsp1 lipoprotein [Borrelia miyamotoi LB-2001]ALZ45549.1 Vsp3S [Borrelia miyamotoi]